MHAHTLNNKYSETHTLTPGGVQGVPHWEADAGNLL